MKKTLLIFLSLISANLFAQSGALDSTFGVNGKVVSTINNSGFAAGVAVTSAGQILVTGGAALESGYDLVLVRYLSNGDLDNGFGNIGVVASSFGGPSYGSCMVIQTDGKIVIAGKVFVAGSYNFLITRYLATGILDTSFGNHSGFVITDLGKDDEATSVNLQTDGKIVVAGFSKDSVSYGVGVVRYNSDGSLDNTFGSAGIAKVALVENPASPAPKQKPDAKMQADGKIVVVSSTFNTNSNHDFVLIRFNSDGTPDNTFGSSSIVTTDFNGDDDCGYSLAIQPDGKIIAGGSSFDNMMDAGYMALSRYNPDGSLDYTFGDSGKVKQVFVYGGIIDASSLIVQSDGWILAGGTDSTPTFQVFGLARYNTHGTVDSSFGVNGLTTTSFSGVAAFGNAIVQQPDEKIVFAGGGGYGIVVSRYLDSLQTPDTAQTTEIYAPSYLTQMNIRVYPIPFSNSATLEYVLSNDDNVSIYLYDISGSLITALLDNSPQTAGSQKQNLLIPAKLNAGNYLLTLTTASGLQSTLKIVKQ
jgi:uncharacterized delta-60 repeat protein